MPPMGGAPPPAAAAAAKAAEVDRILAGLGPGHAAVAGDIRTRAARGNCPQRAGLFDPCGGSFKIGVVRRRIADQLIKQRIAECAPPLRIGRGLQDFGCIGQGGDGGRHALRAAARSPALPRSRQCQSRARSDAKATMDALVGHAFAPRRTNGRLRDTTVPTTFFGACLVPPQRSDLRMPKNRQ